MPDRRDGERHGIALALLITAVLLGCGHKSPAPPTPTASSATPAVPFAQSSDEEQYDKQDPCALLDPKEVEAVLGAPLATPPYRSGGGAFAPTPTGESCVYETSKFRYISLNATYEGGQQVYSMTSGMLKNLLKSGPGSIGTNVKKNFKLDDGTEMTGEWDEASLTPMNCCIFNALRGDQLITLDFTGSPATLRQAATLVDAAFKRIDQPLKISGGAGVKAAKALDKTRPKPVEACSLLTRAEVEAIVGPMAGDPQSHGESGCTFNLRSQNGLPKQVELEIRWRNGYYDWRSDHHVGAIGTAAVTQMATDVHAGIPVPGLPSGAQEAKVAAGGESTSGADPAEVVGESGVRGFTAVKRDVLIRVVSQGTDASQQKALVTAVMQKI